MRITTWNINSVRLRIGLLARLAGTLNPDIVCLQETKAEDGVFPVDAVRGLGFEHRLIRGQKGYNGVAILSKLPIAEGASRQWCARDDCRHIAALLPGGVELHNFYVPAGGDVPDPEQNDKFAHKLSFVAEMTEWARGLGKGKRILVGDLNIAPLPTDVWSHGQMQKVVSHTPVEVAGMARLMAAHDWRDAVRRFIPPEQTLYSWWSYRNRSWPGSDRGRRLDHIWVTPALQDTLRAAIVLREARGWDTPSDHVPVTVDIDI